LTTRLGIFSLLLTICSISSFTQEYILRDQQDTALEYIGYFPEDEPLTPEEAMVALGFQRPHNNVPALGFHEKGYWMRFSLSNQGNQGKRLLEFAYTPVDLLELYCLQDPSQNLSLGTARPYSQRPIDYRHLIFPLEVPPGETYTYLMRVKTRTSINLPLIVWRPHSLYQHIGNDSLILGLFYGIMILLFIYNLFKWFTQKDQNYLFYLFWLIGATMVQFCLNGFGYQYLLGGSPWWNLKSTSFFMALGGFFGLWFARSFLETKARNKAFDRVLLGLMVLCFLGILGSLVLPYGIIIRYMTVMWVILPVFMLALSVRSLIQGFIPARFFLIAWGATFVGTMVFALKSLGVLPYGPITNWSMQVSLTLQIVLVSVGLGDRVNLLEHERKRNQELLLETKTNLLESFSRFVPKPFLGFLGRDDLEAVQMGDAVKKEMTILFSDIRRFTQISENLSVDDSFTFLNDYLGRMQPVVNAHGGFVDKYIGDAILALFAHEPADAVRAAVEMRQALREFNQGPSGQSLGQLEMGVGIHTGELMLGTVGSEHRMDTTVIGDSVNLCSRLQDLTKEYGVPIIISEPVKKSLSKDWYDRIREIDRVRVKGKDRPVRLYEVFGADSDEIRDNKIRSALRFQQAIELYRAGILEEAQGLFWDALKLSPDDPVIQLYLNRVKALLEQADGTCVDPDISQYHTLLY
jgi:class 3 adenylate cyclase